MVTPWFSGELDHLDQAELGCFHPDAVARYYFYRRHGLGRAEAFTAARCWGRNRTEQAARRFAHETGAEPGDHNYHPYHPNN